MNKRMQQRIAAFKEMAAPANDVVVQHPTRADSLSKVVRSQKDADALMTEIENVVARVRKSQA